MRAMNRYSNSEKVDISLIFDKRNSRENAILYKRYLDRDNVSEKTFRNIKQYLRENEKFSN